MISSSVRPNTIAPRRPLPTGNAFSHLSAGWVYQRTRAGSKSGPGGEPGPGDGTWRLAGRAAASSAASRTAAPKRDRVMAVAPIRMRRPIGAARGVAGGRAVRASLPPAPVHHQLEVLGEPLQVLLVLDLLLDDRQ